VEEAACVYCGYAAPLLEKGGEEKVFAGREACRAVQVAEWRALPEEVREDPMGPPGDRLEEVCGCLHCGQWGPRFEAVEMRWLENEGMWACPCTVCGGRGFEFDIFPVESKWECAECRHRWAPPDGNYKWSNCKCPKCGCTEASGRFEDEYSEEEIDAMTEEEYKEAFGQTRAEEEAEWRAFNEKWEREHPEEAAAQKKAAAERQAAWEEEQRKAAEAEALEEQGIGYDPEAGLAAEREEAAEEAGGFGISYPVEMCKDDIDFPEVVDKEARRRRAEAAIEAAEASAAEHDKERRERGEEIEDDDVPW
jgi:hypothetical protein